MMNKLLQFALCFFMLLYQTESMAAKLCPENFSACLDYAIEKLAPNPNYPLTSDLDDKKQLVDGVLNHDPIWTRSQSIAWQHQTPISLSLKVNEIEIPDSNYSLYFKFGHGSKSGVYMPRFVDVFSRQSDGFMRIGAHFNEKTSSYLSASSWIEVPISSLGRDLEVLIHSKEVFISIDEIVISKSSSSYMGVGNMLINNEENPIHLDSLKVNSIKKLKAVLTQKNNSKSAQKSGGGLNTVCIKLEEPWSKIDKEVCAISENKLHKNLLINENDYFVVKVFNGGDIPQELTLNRPMNSEFSIGELNEILVADGSLVFDPITPVVGPVIVGAHEKKIFFVSIKFNQSNCSDVCIERYPVSISLNSSDLITEVDYSVLNLKASNLNKYEPYAVTWGYSRDKPIWSEPEKNVVDLKSHGVNVFLVHPHYLPSPYNAKGFSAKNFLRLVDEFKLYKEQGLLLLYTGMDGWHKDKSKEKPTNSDWVDWLKVIKKAINVADVNSAQWSVFLIDEPASSELRLLSEIASDLKSIDKEISIYANPISSSSKTTKIQDLMPLIGLVDIWQPSMKFAESSVWQRFKRNIDQFWVYGGPDGPVKAALPSVYRELSHEAIRIGATGIGFWSYSDTSGSSAWDDFDGRRPDWSIVYEVKNGFISSRRWEAFAKGIEEYKISHQLSQEVAFSGLGDVKSISQKIKTNRSELFRMIDQQLNNK